MKPGLWLAAVMCTCAVVPAHAQEEDRIDQFFSQIDTNDDDTLSLAEMKAQAWLELEEDTSEREKLVAWRAYLIDLLVADTDEDLSVTRKEFRDYINAMQSDVKIRFTAADWSTYRKEYLDPFFSVSLKEGDKDQDGALGKAEYTALAHFGEEDFSEADKDKDGKVTTEEYRALVKGYLSDYYDFEGEVPKGIKDSFAACDTNGDKLVSKSEWKAAMHDPKDGAANWWGVYVVFLAADTNEDNTIDFDEYVFFGQNQRAGTKHKLYPMDRKAALDEVWGAVDTNKDGSISRAELLAQFLDDEGVGEEFDGADTNKDEMLSRDEFWQILKAQIEPLGYEFPDQDPEGLGSNAVREVDAEFTLYTKAGRNWTHRQSSNYDGVEFVNYTRVEVIKVEDDHAVVAITLMDKDRKALPGRKPREAKILFKKEPAAGDAETAPKDLGRKSIEVEAGTFDCTGIEVTVETEAGKTTTTSWSHAAHTRLIVKSESRSETGTNSIELVEFNE